MQQFVVPQFIDVEDKIIGPITTRQFIIMLVVGLAIFIFYKILAFIPFVISAILLFGAGGVIAFLRINGQPFHFFLLNVFQTSRRPKLKVWNKELTDAELRERLTAPLPPHPLPPPRKELLTTSRLNEIALVVDTGGVYTPE
ncbi:MAG: hypothetical protein UX17_C0030G0017 [Parcubacteria group bacterium GW2011_GWC2_45_7]|nr:MAG: hypothetical protein UX17_C0030G0017 [Parcubacteria group bacterium GW2011_GWC2_45_7]KKU74011.1 MAG: hypothetical protein UX98_C0002G0041 [Parcubacteria group bacterium GW2011_GWA2_47_26]